MVEKPASRNATVLGLAHLLIQVSDLDAAQEFYCGVLGFEIKSRGIFGGNRPLIVTVQGLGMTLLPQASTGNPAHGEQNLEHIAFWVSNIEGIGKVLQDHGYSVDGPKRNEYGRSLSVHDPDGNRVECIESELPKPIY